MLKKILANRGIELTEQLSNSVVINIKSRIKQNRKTSLHELLKIAERCNKALTRCA
jgi:hypothetical protein